MPPPPPPSLPPHPPPPPPQLLDTNLLSCQTGQSERGGTVLKTVITSFSEETEKAVQIFRCFKGISEDECNKYTFVSNYKSVVPVIQNGPLCGMVALAMASDLVGGAQIRTEDVLTYAQNMGYSKQGEIFSASSMLKLATHFLPGHCELWTLRHDEDTETGQGKGQGHGQGEGETNHDKVMAALLRGSVLLVPYDSDKNHSPCLRRGHKAHWALITGFFLGIPPGGHKIQHAFLNEICSLDADNNNKSSTKVWRWPHDDLDLQLSDQHAVTLTSSCPADNTFVFAHQGKSKHTGIWTLSDLLKSNGNLVEAGLERNTEEYVLPEGGLEQGLRSQIVVVNCGS